VQRSSPRITIDIESVRGFSDGEAPLDWLVNLEERYNPIFTVEIPLELVDVIDTENGVLEQSSSPSLVFVPCNSENVQGVMPDMYTHDALRTNGELGTEVDSLSRSVHATDLDAATVIDTLQTQTDIYEEHLDALKHNLHNPAFSSQLNTDAVGRTSQLLRDNVRRHEREHIRCLLDPMAAIWRELELYQLSVTLASSPQRWNDLDFLDTFATLYAIPNCYVAEILAMSTEDYTTADSTVQRAVESYVASQNETQAELLRFIDRHNIDMTSLVDTLRSPVGELYCDFWLAYIIDQVRAGETLAEIDAAGFRASCNPPIDSIGLQSPDRSRETLVDSFNDRWKGPVAEFVCLTFVNDGFVLRRSWISMNPSASDVENLLSVRRALFRRRFLSFFVAKSGLDAVLDARTPLIGEILWGTPLSDVSLFRRSSPPPKHLAGFLGQAHDTARDTLLSPQATTDDLNAWFNDPDYGF
jgi:hypothetical protein